MSYAMTMSIPIRSHLKKMLSKYRETEPFVLTAGRDHYSALIYSTLHRQSFPQNVFKHQKISTRFNDQLNVFIPESIARENRVFCDPKRISFLDAQLMDIFDEKLMEYLDGNCFQKGDIQKYCQRFLQYYGILEEEITMDALVKSYYRYRQNLDESDKKSFRAKKNTHESLCHSNSLQLSLLSDLSDFNPAK